MVIPTWCGVVRQPDNSRFFTVNLLDRRCRLLTDNDWAGDVSAEGDLGERV